MIQTKRRNVILFMGVIIAALWLVIAPYAQSVLPADLSHISDIRSIRESYSQTAGQFLNAELLLSTSEYTRINADEISYSHFLRTDGGERIGRADSVIEMHRSSGIVKNVDTADAYVFAPNNVNFGTGFTGWDPVFQTSVEYQYIAPTTIQGLSVIHYSAEFEQVNPLVYAEEYTDDISASVTRDIWVEPWTATLIDMKEVITLNRVFSNNVQTPLSQYTNVYSKETVARHAETAEKRQSLQQIIRLGIPFILAIGVLMTLIAYQFKNPRSRRISTIAFAVILLIGIIVFFAHRSMLRNAAQVVPTIGVMSWVHDAILDENYQGFLDGLRENGYIDGKTVNIVERFGNGTGEDEIDLLRSLNIDAVDLAFIQTTRSALAAKDLLTMPIVFSVSSHPLEAGVVNNLAVPGENITGSRHWILADTQMATITQMLPDINRIGFLRQAGFVNSEIQFNEFTAAGSARGIETVDLIVNDISEVRSRLSLADIDAVYFACDALLALNSKDIVAVTKELGIPEISCADGGVDDGALMGVVADMFETGKIAAEKAARVLEGEDAGTIEVGITQTPIILLNRTRLEELGLAAPQDILTKAEFVD